MTDIRKSDAQLDAEAAEDRDLDAAIAAHRLMYRADNGLPLKLHQRDGDDSGLGAPFNAILAAYLDGSLGHTDSWNSALLWLRERVCRANHSKHWEPKAWQGSLCYRLVSFVVRLDLEMPEAMARLGLTDAALSERTLDSALRIIENRLEFMLRADPPEVKREPIEWMSAPHVHHRLEGLHAEDCGQCRRTAA